MKLYDQHVHSALSSDSIEKYENYLNLAQKLHCTHFVTTEHMDLSCISMGGDDLPDFVMYDKLLQKFQKNYSLCLLKGIEIGYKLSRAKDIQQVIENQNFDLIIMSIHESEDASCTSSQFLGNLTPDQCYSKYLDLYIDMVDNCNCYDIVGHIDFLLRYIPKANIENNKNKLKTLLQRIIANDKCLECNTRFLYQHKDSTYLKYIFSMYYALGGRKISLGSDAHAINNFYAGFDEAQDILKNIGFTHITLFQNRQETRIKI